ncbi:ABC transporter substrate-binding protein [Amnibacterium flavum]|uniref:Thiamine pyrimidine synthase n=1 Tax=Amnibacterium flavum TaxID=2173173 RepID=A0A2V1HY57_9MICO|nr:ABC transporter substrate-binding protein [Amnibacterium flavum]PVZ95677.1 ABC transporter substrate-binding protein [Amnibacterium flavum]
MARFTPKTARKTALAVAAAAVALTLAACSGGTSDSGSGSGDDGADADFGELNLQLSWIKNEEFAGEFFADSKGYYTDAGFSAVNMTPGPSTGTAELLSGSADVALSDSVSVGTVIANEDAPLKIIGATFQANPFTILSLKDGANITTPEEMVGKKIGVQASNTSLFEAFLTVNDIDPSSLTVVPVEYDPSVLVNGDVDGFVAYQTNEAITVPAGGNPVTLLNFADNGLPFVAETVTVTDQMIAEDREKLKAFLVAEIKGWTDAIADPAAAADLAVNTYGADLGLNIETSTAGAEAQAKLAVSADTEANGLFVISDDLQASTIKSLAAAGIDVSAEDLFDLSLLDEVYEENPDLIDYAG